MTPSEIAAMRCISFLRITGTSVGRVRSLATISYYHSDIGFSLVELVIVIAILGILITVSFPMFQNVQKDAQISQAKNALATIIKECAVSELRLQRSPTLNDTRAAKGRLSGYELKAPGGVNQLLANGSLNPAYLLNSCKSVEAHPLVRIPTGQGAMPDFSISSRSGGIDKECSWFINPLVYEAGCDKVSEFRGVALGVWD